MLKKHTLWLIIFILIVMTLCSCNLIKMEKHPAKFPMSKWAGEGIELYILDGELNDGKDLIIVDCADSRFVFDVVWRGNGLWCLDMFQRNNFQTEQSQTSNEEKVMDSIGSFELTILDSSRCRIEKYISNSFPNGMAIKDNIILSLTTTDLSLKDIPMVIE